MGLTLLPDAEELVVNRLLEHPNMSALVDNRVGTELAAAPEFPSVVVERIGGIPKITQYFDRARMDIGAWGNTKAEAQQVAATAQAVLHQIIGAHPEGVVTAVIDDQGLVYRPDPETDQPRYKFGVLVHLHPNPA